MVVFDPTATKLYQTSFLLETPQPIEAIVVKDDPTNEPAVFEQAALEVKLNAPVHSSLDGGTCVTQMLKSATPPAPEGLLLRLATRI